MRLWLHANGVKQIPYRMPFPWRDPACITEVVHPEHGASSVGFSLGNGWINEFWNRLATEKLGIRVQIHTHPGAAYHSSIDDAYPIIHSPGFLSLVIPNFGLGPIGFEAAFLAEINGKGSKKECKPNHPISPIGS